MKTFKYLAIVMAAFFFFAACQKEFSAENGYALGAATGSLKNDSGQCRQASVKGSYVTNVAMQDSNYVIVQVNFASAGRYKISTDTSNGFSFLDSGVTVATGLQSIRLKASGTPIAARQTSFFVTFDTSSCSFTIPVTDTAANSATPAVYTLAGSPGNCANALVQGTYKAGTQLTSSNQVSIQLNVTKPGSYSISAGPLGGMSFGARGIFTTTGLQTVLLQGSGTPAAAGNDTIPITAGGTSCSFVVTVSSATGQTAADSAWSFSSGTNFYNGTLDSVFIQKDSLGTTHLVLVGLSAARDKFFLMDIPQLGTTVQAGTYNTKANAAFNYADTTNVNNYITANPNSYIYYADPTTTAVNIQIVISSYDPLTKMVMGTFAGTAKGKTTASIPITTGKFKAVIK